MTLGAGIARWTHVLERRLNWFCIRVERDGVELMNTVEFGFHVPSRALSDMAINATQTRVRRVLERNKFRFHYGVARLATESNRLGVFVSLVAAERADCDEDNC